MSNVWHWPKKLQAELLRTPRRPRPLPPLSAEGKPPHPHLHTVSMWSLLLHCMSAHADTALSATSNQPWFAMHIKRKLCVGNAVLYQAGDRHNAAHACLYLLSKMHIPSGQAFTHQAFITATSHVQWSFPCCGGLSSSNAQV